MVAQAGAGNEETVLIGLDAAGPEYREHPWPGAQPAPGRREGTRSATAPRVRGPPYPGV